MEKLFEVFVTVDGYAGLSGISGEVGMLSFSGYAEGEHFMGKIIGSAVDTQIQRPGEQRTLSARYMLEGTDRENRECRVFIENNGSFEQGFTPTLITDSPSLNEAAKALTAKVEPRENGVKVEIWAG